MANPTKTSGTLRVAGQPSSGAWLPSRRLVHGAIVSAVIALGVLIWSQTLVVVVAVDILLLGLCVADVMRTPRQAVAIEREVPAVLALGRPNTIRLRLTNCSSHALSVEVNDDLFDGALAQGLPGRIELEPLGSATVCYQVHPSRRGAYAFGDHFVRYNRHGSLLIRQERIEAHDGIRVYPDVLALRQYDSSARRGKEHLSGTARMRGGGGGGGGEFEQLKPYARDDEYRHIDWRATARRRAITSRQFKTETQQSVLVMIDCGRAMRAEAQGLSFLDHALNATLMLSHVALSHGDHAGILAFDSVAREFVPPGPGLATERRIIQAVFDLDAKFAEPDFLQMFSFVKTRVRRRSLVVLFTQVLDASAAANLSTLLRGLVPEHLPLCVLLRDRDVDQLASADVLEPLGLYTCGAAAETILWRDQLVRDMRSAGALVIDAYPEQVTPEVVGRYVDVKARRLL